MIIVHFAEYASGGVSTYLKDLINYQIEQSYVDKIYLIVSDFKTDEELLTMKNNKLKIIPYAYRRSISGLFKLLSMSQTISRINPDIIHLHSSFAGIIRVKYIFSPIKEHVIYCSHGWAFNRDIGAAKKIIYKLVEKVLSLGCKKIINISKSEEKSAYFINKKKMITIYNSIPDN